MVVCNDHAINGADNIISLFGKHRYQVFDAM